MKFQWPLSIVAAAALLWRYPPDRYAFYPECPIYETFGLLCPGCGATRAASSLLHGRVVDALHWNALFVAVILAVAMYALTGGISGKWPRPRGWLVACSIAVAALFGVARNLV